jgi:PDZ domain-containing secreted protein
MGTREIDVVDRMRYAHEALAGLRQPIVRRSIAPADPGHWPAVVAVFILAAGVACACVVGADQRNAARRPAFASDTARIVRIDGKSAPSGHLLFTAVRRSRPSSARTATAREATAREAMETSQQNAVRAALDCVPPGSRRAASIEPGKLTGGSAGLMFALTIVDALDPLDIDGQIAGTGTISSTGVVGPIDEIALKARAALYARADMFLVPKAQAALAKRAAPDLRVVGVETLDEAVRSLGRTDGCHRAKGGQSG